MDEHYVTLTEALKRLRRGGDPMLATQLHNYLRFSKGLTYRKCVDLYAEINQLDDHTALSEWDEHMLASEKAESF
jgi:hypothetical protein